MIPRRVVINIALQQLSRRLQLAVKQIKLLDCPLPMLPRVIVLLVLGQDQIGEANLAAAILGHCAYHLAVVPELKVFDVSTDDFTGELKLRLEINVEGDENTPSVIPYYDSSLF